MAADLNCFDFEDLTWPGLVSDSRHQHMLFYSVDMSLPKLYLKPIFVFKNNLNPLKWLEVKEFCGESSRTVKGAFTLHPKYMCTVIFFFKVLVCFVVTVVDLLSRSEGLKLGIHSTSLQNLMISPQINGVF